MSYSTIEYFDLAAGAPRRLARLRHDFASHAKNFPHCPEYAKPKSWRDLRRTTYASVEAYCATLDQGFNGTGAARVPVWYCHTGPQFRAEKFADESSLTCTPDHRGWFADIHDDDVVRGIYARLPHDRFIAGYHCSSNGERVYFGGVYDDEADAVRAADEHARVYAEACKEDSEKGAAAQKLQEELEDLGDKLSRSYALRNHPRHKASARDEVPEYIERIRDKRATLATEYKDYL